MLRSASVDETTGTVTPERHAYRAARRSAYYALNIVRANLDPARELDDYVHDAFVTFLEKGLNPFEQPVSHVCVSTKYRVYRVARNYTTSGKRLWSSLGLLEDQEVEVEAVVDYIEAGEATADLKRALELCEEHDNGYLLVLAAMGYGRDEMADVLDCNVNTVVKRIMVVRRYVRNGMGTGLQPE